MGKITHGLRKIPEYMVWAGMFSRCYNKNERYYKDYGGRGIVVCDGWKKFENFISDMGTRPTDKHSIDRIENDANYSCGHCEQCLKNGWKFNCRWVTKSEQTQNRRKTVWVEYKGEKQPLDYWRKKLHISPRKIKRWVVNGAFKLEDVENVFKSYLSKEVKNRVTGQVYHSIREAADSIKMHPDSLRNRLKGKTPNDTNFELNQDRAEKNFDL